MPNYSNTHPSGRKRCPQCGRKLNSGRKFCSRQCKNESQKRRISIVCKGCLKKFSILPYLKRQTNYCSRQCYWNSTKEGEHRNCLYCGNKFYAKGHLIKKGFGFYCNRECQFNAYPKKIEKKCLQCDSGFEVWPTNAETAKFCSKKCKDDCERDYLERRCRNCQKVFQLPRSDINRGRGSFCSRDCYNEYNGETSIEQKVRIILQKAGIDFQQEVKMGVYRADFLLKDSNIVLECDGEYWHSIPKAIERDKRKDNYLTRRGFRIYRIPEKDIKNSGYRELVKLIQSFLE